MVGELAVKWWESLLLNGFVNVKWVGIITPVLMFLRFYNCVPTYLLNMDCFNWYRTNLFIIYRFSLVSGQILFPSEGLA